MWRRRFRVSSFQVSVSNSWARLQNYFFGAVPGSCKRAPLLVSLHGSARMLVSARAARVCSSLRGHARMLVSLRRTRGTFFRSLGTRLSFRYDQAMGCTCSGAAGAVEDESGIAGDAPGWGGLTCCWFESKLCDHLGAILWHLGPILGAMLESCRARVISESAHFLCTARRRGAFLKLAFSTTC